MHKGVATSSCKGSGILSGARKDPQIITDAWQKPDPLIDGVSVHEVRHVPRDHGVITELYRPQWDPTGLPLVHAYQARLYPGAIGASSCHARTIDRHFVNQGILRVVLYDGREDSRSAGRINELHVGDARPALVILPIGVWHGLQNLGDTDALALNSPSEAYNYADLDPHRLPADTREIPYTWNTARSTTRLRSDAK